MDSLIVAPIKKRGFNEIFDLRLNKITNNSQSGPKKQPSVFSHTALICFDLPIEILNKLMPWWNL
jgi:hypothetical protein